ncbi:hypothetical protein ACFJIW_11225 [Tahibacter sp. UC22_41]|uniref:hypothetical protein n=1 Tax=Tahibacter sp. UC22_41 TaxID=3350178 RepID=UPI0036D9A15B
MKPVLLVLGLLLSLVSHASTAADVAETDDEKFIRLTAQLEKNPLGDPDKSIRSWLFRWLLQRNDLSVQVCDILGPVWSGDAPHWPELLNQYIFGNAAFQFSHRGQKNDKETVQIAGVRSAMRAYSALLTEDPKARIAYFDTLLDQERSGSLSAFLAPKIAEKCPK